MQMLGYALAQAGLVSEETVRHVEGQAALKAAVRSAYQKAKRTGKPADWKRYASLKRRLPRNIRWQY